MSTTTTSQTAFILKLAAGQALTPLLDQHHDVVAALMEQVEEHPAYAQLWESLPADARPELTHYAAQLLGLVSDAFLAGLICAHVPLEA